MESKQQLEERISELLRSRAFRVQKEERADDRFVPDMVFRSGNSELVVQCRVMSVYRASDFRAAIGDAILRFQHMDRCTRSARRHLLMAFLLQRMSSKVGANLQDYARNYPPYLKWIVLAEDGSGVMHVGEQNESVSAPPFQDAALSNYGANRGSLFPPTTNGSLRCFSCPG